MKPSTLQITKASRGYQLLATQDFQKPIEEVFDFFADAFKLEPITPPFLKFSVLTPPPIVMREGLKVDHALRLRGLPIRWQSLISVWEPPFRFVDEQLKGPYKRWYHDHVFESIEGGTRVTDMVDYQVPLGGLLHGLFIKRDLLNIFSYRHKQLETLIGRS